MDGIRASNSVLGVPNRVGRQLSRFRIRPVSGGLLQKATRLSLAPGSILYHTPVPSRVVLAKRTSNTSVLEVVANWTRPIRGWSSTFQLA